MNELLGIEVYHPVRKLAEEETLRRCHLSVIVVLLLFGLGGMLAAQTTSEDPTDAETYAAYSAVVNKMFLPTEVKRLVIVSTTISYFPKFIDSERQTAYLDNFPGLEAETAESAKIRKETRLLEKRFVLPVECTLVTEDELEGYFTQGSGGWSGFNHTYPDSRGFLRFSRVAFNRAATQAFLYVEHRCGGLCGTGHHVFLSKQDGKWVVKKTHLLWIS